MKKIFLILVAGLVLAGCGKSCEELGGKKVPDGGHIQMVQYSKGISTPIWIRDYKCIGALDAPLPKAYKNEPGKRWWEDSGSVK